MLHLPHFQADLVSEDNKSDSDMFRCDLDTTEGKFEAYNAVPPPKELSVKVEDKLKEEEEKFGRRLTTKQDIKTEVFKQASNEGTLILDTGNRSRV